MESVQSEQESKLAPEMEDLLQAMRGVEDGGKQPSKLDRARKIAQGIASASKELDRHVEQMGALFEEVLVNELGHEQASEKLTDNGYLEPKDHPLGIPNSINQDNLERLEHAQHVIFTALPSELREHASFLVSFCNSLILERGFTDAELLRSREARRNAIAEIIKISNLNQFKTTWRR